MAEIIPSTSTASMNDQEAAERFTGWLETQVLAAARGDEDQTSEHERRGKYFLGRLASEQGVAAQATLGERFERMEPCAVGIRLKPDATDAWDFDATASCVAWLLQA